MWGCNPFEEAERKRKAAKKNQNDKYTAKARAKRVLLDALLKAKLGEKPDAATKPTNPANSGAIIPTVAIRASKIMTSSLNVAAIFGKRHDNILREIRGLDIPSDLRGSFFTDVFAADLHGRMQPVRRSGQNNIANCENHDHHCH